MSGTNWPTTQQGVRRPRWRVLVAGTTLTGCESVQVHSTNHRKASTFSARFALGADPNETGVWFDQDPPISFEVQAAFLAPTALEGTGAWQSVFIGEVDSIHLDPVQGAVEVSGRDLMGRLIDARIRNNYANQKSSEIAQTLAGQYGLTADVDPTSTPAGAYYQLEHDQVNLDGFAKTTSPNDLLLFLARMEGFDYWVDGTVLHFKQAVDASTATPLTLAYRPRGPQAFPIVPVSDIRMDRSLVLDKGVKVTVKTWDAKHKGSHVISYPPGAAKDAHEYVYVRAGLSPDKALAFAQSQYADILKHERTVDIAMPGELQLTARSIVQLSGAPGTSFNIRFYVDEISREFGLDSGFQQHVVLKNRSPQSDASVG